jgi:hypothetical protein
MKAISMKSVSSILILIATLSHVSFAASPSLDSVLNLTAAIEKFHVDYESLEQEFAEKLCTAPREDPVLLDPLVGNIQHFYSSMFLMHLSNHDYVKSYLDGAVDIKHILGLAKLLTMYESYTVVSLPGFTQKNVVFLKAVEHTHHTLWKNIKLPLRCAQHLAIERRALQVTIMKLNQEKTRLIQEVERLRSALEKAGTEQ